MLDRIARDDPDRPDDRIAGLIADTWGINHFGPLLASLGGLAAIAVVTWRGYFKYGRMIRQRSHMRLAVFLVGLGATAVAFFGPLPDLGHKYFFMHQVDHLVARLLGPMLIALSRPGGWLAAGLSRRWRAKFSSVFRLPLVRAVRSPFGATIILILSLYIWQLPAIYAYAQVSEMLEFTAHLGMAAAGISYFLGLFSPSGLVGAWSYGARLMSVFVVIVSNILLGALITLKEVALYSSSPMTLSIGERFGLADETTGGCIIWVPSSMVMIVAILLVMNEWNKDEEERWQVRNEKRLSNSAALEFPETAYELKLKSAEPNRRMGQTLAIGSLAMFTIVILTAVTVLQLY